LLALGSSASSAAGSFGNDGAEGATLDFVSFDPAKPGNQMEVIASVQPERGLKFASMSWGKVSREGFPNGVLAGGLQEGVVSLWNPYAIVKSKGADPGLVYSGKIHSGTVNCVEFNPFKPNLMATAGADSEVNILDIGNIQQPELYKPSANNKHAGSEVLCCAWNRGVPHILCSSSNTGATVVWDLRKKAEVLTFQDPGGRQRCADVAWHPEVPTQLIVAYDDDQQPSMQMWDLRHAQYPFKETQGHSKGVLLHID
jgi:protein transport protein SEC31